MQPRAIRADACLRCMQVSPATQNAGGDFRRPCLKVPDDSRGRNGGRGMVASPDALPIWSVADTGRSRDVRLRSAATQIEAEKK